MNKANASFQLEAILSLNLPPDYKDFIDSTGYLGLNNIGMEVYGYKPGYDVDKIPCVVAATKLYREECHLSNSEIVISHTGYEGRIVVLDTISGQVYEAGFPGTKDKIADSFSLWLHTMQLKNS